MLGRERHVHGVAGHGAEMVDQASEAVDALSVGVALDRLLVLHGFGRLGLGHRRAAVRSSLIEIGVVEQQRRQGLAQMPLDMVGEPAQEEAAPGPEPMPGSAAPAGR